jgi:hypothetical protein
MIDLFGEEVKEILSLADKYLMAPTTVLNTRDPKWQDLKRKWINKGIQSEIGRMDSIKDKHDKRTIGSYGYGSNFVYKTYGMNQTMSIFDPVLCEIMYKWFCPNNGLVIDPFAGGSVRGIIANYLGYNYTGIELRREQVESNKEQALTILPVNRQPQYYIGDSERILNDLIPEYDMLFSCPPYMNLEIYSDLEDDLSNMNDIEFINKYNSIIFKSCDKLKHNRYAVWVVGDVRDNKGFYKDFTGITKQAFKIAGMKLYNELILVNNVGTKALSMERGFKSGKLAKVHQNIYIFKKT